MFLLGARPLVQTGPAQPLLKGMRLFLGRPTARQFSLSSSALSTRFAAKPPVSRLGLRMASTKATESSGPRMPWSEFFKLRKRRRIVGFATSVFTATFASALAFQYFANLVIDFNKTFMGIEMQWIYLGGIVVSGFLGWVVGPVVGSQIFNILIGSSRTAFHQMDNVFLKHVAKNRPNPVRHNVNTNPLPDYYGEKIGSLHDYRQWLREGHLFEKKASKFL